MTSLMMKICSLLGPTGMMVGSSKSIYLYENPNNLVVFNANLCTKEGKVWHGDLDLTLVSHKIQQAASATGETLYVLYEQDARFENEENPLLSEAVMIFEADKTPFLSPKYETIAYLKGGIPFKKKIEPVKLPSITYNADDFFAYSLPDFRNYKISKSKSPLHFYEKELIRLHGEEKAQEIVTRVHVTEAYDTEFREQLTAYLKKYERHLHPVKIQQSVDWALLNIGPIVFQGDPSWAEYGVGYVKLRK